MSTCRQFRVRLPAALLTLAVCLVWAAVPTQTAAAPVVQLLRPDSLAGWDHHPAGVEGWRVADGVLHGSAGGRPLVSGFSYGDVELALRWRADGAPLAIELLPVPSGDAITLSLPATAQWRTAQVRRAGNQLTLRIDGTNVSQQPVDPQARFVLAFAAPTGDVAVADLRASEPLGEASLFNGTDLTGWWCNRNAKAWTVENGEIVCLNQGGGYICTDKEYGNYTLTLEYKIARGGNSGIGVRTPMQGWPSSDGMETQIMDESPDKPITRHSTMAIYGNLEPFGRADIADDYNQVVLKLDGYMLSAWINGELIQQVNTAHLPELRYRNLTGWIGFQDHNNPVRFRNIRLLEAPAGRGLDLWYRPPVETASQLVLGGIMNPVRFYQSPPLDSRFVTVRAEAGDQESTLVELDGPAAITNMARSNSSGELAFYFDGEAEPRVRAAAGELHKLLPPVGENPHPVITYVPFGKHLRITIAGNRPVEYTFDVTRFTDAALPVEEYVDEENSSARGLLPALSYRLLMFSLGRLRSYDPLPRVESAATTIEPGSTTPLVAVDGAGVALWWQLTAPASALATDDLWLEFTVDGEAQPALAAPARLLFPHRVGEGRFRNLVLGTLATSHFCNLPLPFGNGMRIEAVNRGSKPIKAVTMSISYQAVDNAAEVAAIGRLRGKLLPAAKAGEADFIQLAGAGRLLGLIYEPRDGHLPKFARVLLDGQPRDDALPPGLQRLIGAPNEGDVRYPLSGRSGGFAWRYFLNAPVGFEKSLVVQADPATPLGQRLLLYVDKP